MTDTPSTFELRGASVRSPYVRLGPLDWEIPDRQVTALLGPAGTGKSTLLRAVAGHLDASWARSGAWRFRGDDVADRLSGGLEGIYLRPQPPREGPRALPSPDELRGDTSDRLVLLDEPERLIDTVDRPELIRRIRAVAEDAAVVVVTHDLSFARRVADRACLLAAGRILECLPTRDFFEHPSTPATARFVRDGNCWPVPSWEPPLPSHFHWIIPAQLAGMAYPGLMDTEEDELEAIARAGIEILVSTTREPFPRERLRAFGIEGRHLPIRDMDVPAERHVASLCAGIDRALAAGRPVAIHCKAGLGRTGLVLASVLVWRGVPAEEAVAQIRAIQPGYIQTAGQLQFVHNFGASR